jgi:hypothetical protein
MCQGRSCARVALNVGIEAGIHNFSRISYRLFRWPSFLTYAGFPQLMLGWQTGAF